MLRGICPSFSVELQKKIKLGEAEKHIAENIVGEEPNEMMFLRVGYGCCEENQRLGTTSELHGYKSRDGPYSRIHE